MLGERFNKGKIGLLPLVLLMVALALLTVFRVMPVMAHGEGGGDHNMFGNQSFQGRYITAYHGFDSSITGTASEPNPPAIPFAVSGTINADGKGNVSSGFQQVDYGSPGTGAASSCTETGTYSVSSNGQVTLNLNSTCTTVTCTLVSGAPSCAPSGAASATPTQWFCTLSDPTGQKLDCTEMGEAASGTTFQTPISAVSWSRIVSNNGDGQGGNGQGGNGQGGGD